MTPVHHPPEALLLTYAAGAVEPAVELLLAAHLTLCPVCRGLVHAAEAVGGAALLACDATPLPQDRLEAALARLDRTPTPAPAPARCRTGERIPAPLRRYVGGLDDVRWRRVGPGIRISPVALEDAHHRVFLLDFAPGTVLPAHGHTGVERAMPVRGGFTDEHGHFGAGDVSWHDGDAHRVTIDGSGPCTTLFVTDGPLRVGGALATRALDWWLGQA